MKSLKRLIISSLALILVSTNRCYGLCPYRSLKFIFATDAQINTEGFHETYLCLINPTDSVTPILV